MKFNIRDIRDSLVEKFGEAVIHFQELTGEEAFILNPSYQLCVFNYLMYEKDWKFDTLKDMVLSFNPGLHSCEYSLSYQLNSKLFQNKLKLLLPVDFSNRQAFSLSNQYKNAPKLEQEMTTIYNIRFVTKSSKFADIRKRLTGNFEPVANNLPMISLF